MSLPRAIKHMRAAAVLALLSLEAESDEAERKCIALADWHLFEAQRFRRNVELDAAFDEKLTLELRAMEAA